MVMSGACGSSSCLRRVPKIPESWIPWDPLNQGSYLFKIYLRTQSEILLTSDMFLLLDDPLKSGIWVDDLGRYRLAVYKSTHRPPGTHRD